jgi:ABC-type antimicrobial peptide transport system permease subunit
LLIRIVTEQFKQNLSSFCVSILTYGFDITLIMTLAGLRAGPAAHKFAGTGIITAIALVLAALIVTVSLIFRAINRFVITSDRTYDLSVLILLGALSSQILEWRLVEAFFVAIPGTILGVMATVTIQFIIMSTAFPFLSFAARWEWLVIAATVVTGCELAASCLATWIALRKDILAILASDA